MDALPVYLREGGRVVLQNVHFVLWTVTIVYKDALSKGFMCEVQGFHSCIPEG
jgi:hypothetical protein